MESSNDREDGCTPQQSIGRKIGRSVVPQQSVSTVCTDYRSEEVESPQSRGGLENRLTCEELASKIFRNEDIALGQNRSGSKTKVDSQSEPLSEDGDSSLSSSTDCCDAASGDVEPSALILTALLRSNEAV